MKRCLESHKKILNSPSNFTSLNQSLIRSRVGRPCENFPINVCFIFSCSLFLSTHENLTEGLPSLILIGLKGAASTLFWGLNRLAYKDTLIWDGLLIFSYAGFFSFPVRDKRGRKFRSTIGPAAGTELR
ncbi:hypothetical protein LIER_31685 [Lithospermum erythrorhizon]|uniref:Uncharacterized protein n=1 Tax=Lithospermum erythrorhizon TaxID=34254 RepID=A0AAV3RVP4_LITER